MGTRQSRYDIPAYTEGWFQVAWTKDLGRGELKKVRQFGQDFTLFRGQDGRVGLIDDVCPHLGAHFSEGGCVKGNAVRCPYHAWQFDRDGACVEIPYAKKIPKNAKVGSYTVVEKHGLIFMYRDKAGSRTDAELPPIHDFHVGDYVEASTYEFKIRIHGQDIMENSVDSPHFAAVHGHAMPTNDFFTERDELRVDQTSSVHRFGQTLHFKIEFHMVEPGFHYMFFPQLPGGEAFVFSSIVPVDEEFTNHRLTLMVKKSPIPGYSKLLQRFITWQMMKTYKEDMQIWEHKEYHSRPVLCDGDGSIMKLRKWYAQFYEPQDDASPSKAKRSHALGVVSPVQDS